MKRKIIPLTIILIIFFVFHINNTYALENTYNGFDVVGKIEIPTINISYPILKTVTKDSLEVSVAALWPENAEFNKPGNIVIVGHNFLNGTFFSNLDKLKNGDSIKITDMTDKTINYKIYNIMEVADSDTSFYTIDTNGKRVITLSTMSNNDVSKRLIIQAVENDNDDDSNYKDEETNTNQNNIETNLNNEISNNISNTTQNSPNNVLINNTISNTVSKDKTEKNSNILKLPNTGNNSKFVVFSLLFIIITGIAIYIKYQEYRKIK